jgi:hypothetical protein
MMSAGDIAPMLSSMSHVRSWPWWVKRVLFTALLWTVEAGVLLVLEAWLDGFRIDNFW